MIERYGDHAANERTFLAWVRTAIAIMAFGFLVEKFDLFLRIASESLGARKPLPAGGQIVGSLAGLLFILLGGAMMVLAIIAFARSHSILTLMNFDRAPAHGSTSRSRHCSCCWERRCSFIWSTR